MLITQDFVRSDEDVDGGSFLLYDRRAKIVYRVSREQRRILVMRDQPFDPRVPETLLLEDRVTLAKEAPRIEGRPVYAYALLSDGNVCQQSLVVPGLLAEEAKAIIELRGLLAGRQCRELNKTPKSFVRPAFLPPTCTRLAATSNMVLPFRNRTPPAGTAY